MGWRDKLIEKFQKPTIPWFYGSIPPKQTPMKNEVSIEPGTSYVRVKLNQMFLGCQRRWAVNLMPVVHAFPKFLTSEGQSELPIIIEPTPLKKTGGHLERVITLDKTVFGPMPYLGGELELLIALFSAPTVNYADSFFGLLGSMSDVLPNVELKTAVGLMKPMEKGLEKLLELDQINLKIGAEITFSSPSFHSGYWVLIAKDQKDVDPKNLWITERGLHKDSNGKPGELLTDCDYLVFQIEAVPNRNWRTLPSLNAAWKRVDEAVAMCKGKKEIVDNAYEMFKWTLLGCGELLLSDRLKALDEQTKELTSLWGAGAGRGFGLTAPKLSLGIEELTREEYIGASKMRWQG